MDQPTPPRVTPGGESAVVGAFRARVQRVPRVRRIRVQCRQRSARRRRILAAALPPPLSPVQVDAATRAAGRAPWRAERPGWTEAGWWDVAMLPEVRALLWLPKGPALLTALQQLPTLDGTGCPFPHEGPDILGTPRPGMVGAPCPCQVIVAAAWATAAAWVGDQADHAVITTLGATEQIEVLCPAAPRMGSITDPGIELLAPALRRSPASLRNHLARVRDRHGFPDSLRAAIGDGFLSTWQADLIAQDLQDLEPGVRDLIMDIVTAHLRARHHRGLVGWSFTRIRAYTRTVVARYGHELTRRRSTAHTGRRVTVEHRPAGWSQLVADLPTDVAARIHHHLTALARQSAGDDARSMDQIRADVFTDLLLDPHLSPHAAPDTGEVAVVIAASTLLGADDQAAHLPGCGPVPADVARELAADRKWRAWITNTAGIVIATSPTTYTPTTAVARLVRAREPYCRMPGCRRTRTDLDHVTPYPTGPTTPENLARACRRHHNLKTHGGWHLTNNPDTTYTWTDPHGITHTDHHDPPLPGP